MLFLYWCISSSTFLSPSSTFSTCSSSSPSTSALIFVVTLIILLLSLHLHSISLFSLSSLLQFLTLLHTSSFHSYWSISSSYIHCLSTLSTSSSSHLNSSSCISFDSLSSQWYYNLIPSPSKLCAHLLHFLLLQIGCVANLFTMILSLCIFFIASSIVVALLR